MEKQRPPQEGVDYIVNRDPGDETGDGIEQMTRMAEAYQRDMREILPDLSIQHQATYYRLHLLATKIYTCAALLVRQYMGAL